MNRKTPSNFGRIFRKFFSEKAHTLYTIVPIFEANKHDGALLQFLRAQFLAIFGWSQVLSG
jgi:hypothetical protein